MKLPIPAADKAVHFMYGALAYNVGSLLALAFGMPAYSRAAGMGLTLAVATVKECADWLANRRARQRGATLTHQVEAADFVATALGGAACGLATVGGA